MDTAEIGDAVSWDADPDEEGNPQIRFYGVIRDLDYDDRHNPDAAHVMEYGAWHRVWGHSGVQRGKMHSLALDDLNPPSSTERRIIDRKGELPSPPIKT